MQRLVRLYRTDGATAFASSRRGRPANNRIDEETQGAVVDNKRLGAVLRLAQQKQGK
ncbi:hypothetical protein ACYBNI_27960 [Klebsiella pneumoniae]|uniref:hypothetical protein n=1 Tax=Klebsiella pneumoniae TaxID=573 RepID=UPI002964ED80|nr:hypothetical protein [Klebsiella pneumoniae]MDW1324766.1 hypothetical protein [Klebsiella pneumoniae]